MTLSYANISDLDLEQLFARIVTAGKKIGTTPLLVGGFVRDLVVERLTKEDLKWPFDFSDLDLTEEGGRALELAWAVKQELSIEEDLQWYSTTGTAVMVWKGVKLEFKGPLADRLTAPVLQDLGINSSQYLDVDAYNRDLTLNAMYLRLEDNMVIDHLGMGVPDIKAGLIRTCIPASIAIAYKPIIALRAVRFLCRYNFELSKSVRNAIPAAAEFLKRVELKRLNLELEKLEVYGDQAKRVMDEVGLSSVYDLLNKEA